ncbi:phosphotransferase [Streptomyces sp. NPDC049954]|uniref:phosphotransferase n=1 Tax=Streptomyces sp. NPDC049954 TaxID=3155779 RepID=UPI00343D25A4
MLLDARGIAHRFALGRPLGELRPLANGEGPSGTRVLETDRGRWVVKAEQVQGEWQYRQARETRRLESAALAAGVTMPRPAEPPAPAVGHWHDLAGTELVRVSEWLPGHDLRGPGHTSAAALQEAARWTGSTLARIALLGVESGCGEESRKPLHPLPDWHTWIEEAVAAGGPLATTARALLPSVEEATARIEHAERDRPPLVLVHGDTSRANVLRTPKGHALIDWDGAAADVPWWEAVGVAFRFTSPFNGPTADGDARVVRPLLEAYAERGGPVGASDASAFAGMLRSQLAVTAWCLWLALGHRRADAVRRAFGLRVVTTAARDLPGVLHSLDRWTALLR